MKHSLTTPYVYRQSVRASRSMSHRLETVFPTIWIALLTKSTLAAVHSRREDPAQKHDSSLCFVRHEAFCKCIKFSRPSCLDIRHKPKQRRSKKIYDFETLRPFSSSIMDEFILTDATDLLLAKSSHESVIRRLIVLH